MTQHTKNNKSKKPCRSKEHASETTAESQSQMDVSASAAESSSMDAPRSKEGAMPPCEWLSIDTALDEQWSMVPYNEDTRSIDLHSTPECEIQEPATIHGPLLGLLQRQLLQLLRWRNKWDEASIEVKREQSLKGKVRFGPGTMIHTSGMLWKR